MLSNFTIKHADGKNVDWGITRFPDGQIQAWKDPNVHSLWITCALFTPEDVHVLQQLQYMAVWTQTVVTYLYGARCDKKSEARSKCNVAQMMLDQLKIDEVWCPHNLKRVVNNTNDKLVTPVPKWLFTPQYTNLIVFPDKSAEGRFAGIVPNQIPTVTCGKVRSEDGSITEYSVPDLSSFTGNVLVLDDLCDGGATFIKLAQQLSVPRERLRLYTVHGLYTKGTGELLRCYDDVYCSTSCASRPRYDAVTVPDNGMEFY